MSSKINCNDLQKRRLGQAWGGASVLLTVVKTIHAHVASLTPPLHYGRHPRIFLQRVDGGGRTKIGILRKGSTIALTLHCVLSVKMGSSFTQPPKS